MGHRDDDDRRRTRAGAYPDRLGTPVLPAAAFRARDRACAAPAAAAHSHRGADVRPLCDAAARHRGGVPPQPRRLHHRMDRCPHGAAGRRRLRSRRLHRLRHLHAASARRRHACDRGLPALGAGARRRRPDGGARRPPRAAFHGADGRADRHAQQSDRGQQACRGTRRRLVSRQRDHQGAVSRIPASCATSIRAFSSCTASSA